MLFILAALAVVAAATAGAAPSGALSAPARASRCRNTGLRPLGSNLHAVETATLCLLNQIRRVHALGALRPNRSLGTVAGGQSNDMVLGDYFGDDSRSGQTPLQRIVATHYLRHTTHALAAQNIGWGTGTSASPAGMIAAWMRSPPHRQIILTRSYRDVGIGVAPAAPATLAQGQSGATYTVDFGVRQR